MVVVCLWGGLGGWMWLMCGLVGSMGDGHVGLCGVCDVVCVGGGWGVVGLGSGVWVVGCCGGVAVYVGVGGWWWWV